MFTSRIYFTILALAKNLMYSNFYVKIEFILESIGSTNSPTYCESLQQKLDSIILGYALDKRAKFYAPFANTQRKDWQEITNPVDASYMASSASTQFGGVCKSIRTGLSIQIAYALVGNVNNPQAEIVAISFNWYKLNDINLRVSYDIVIIFINI